MSLNSNTKDATNGAGTAHPSRAPKFTPRFLWGLWCGIDFPVLFLYIFGKIYLPYIRQLCSLFIMCCQHGEVWQCKCRRNDFSTE